MKEFEMSIATRVRKAPNGKGMFHKFFGPILMYNVEEILVKYLKVGNLYLKEHQKRVKSLFFTTIACKIYLSIIGYCWGELDLCTTRQ